MSAVEKISEVLTTHGWPPATLIVVIVLAGSLYVLYGDHREMQEKYVTLANLNLEANLLATNQRKELQSMLSKSLKVQDEHLRMISDMDKARLVQNQLDQQLTAAAVQALRQIADKTDVQVQVVRPEEVLNQ